MTKILHFCKAFKSLFKSHLVNKYFQNELLHVSKHIPNRPVWLSKSCQSRPFLPMSSTTKLSRVDVLSHSITDYVGLTNLEGMMDATIRVNHSMTAKTGGESLMRSGTFTQCQSYLPKKRPTTLTKRFNLTPPIRDKWASVPPDMAPREGQITNIVFQPEMQ